MIPVSGKSETLVMLLISAIFGLKASNAVGNAGTGAIIEGLSSQCLSTALLIEGLASVWVFISLLNYLPLW